MTITSFSDALAQAQAASNTIGACYDWIAANTSYDLTNSHNYMTKGAKSAETVLGLTPGTLQPGGVNKPAV